MMNAFPPEVIQRLGYYVYRLIDPRNGETFYIGKGRGNRVFHHVAASLKQEELEDDEDEISIKIQRVRDISADGLEIIHIIQRHGMTSAEALHVEGALIDAFPGLSNLQNGHGNSDIGAMHAQAVINKYAASRLEPQHRIIFITVRRDYISQRGPYEGCRGVWRMNRNRAEQAELVLPVMEGIVIGVYRPERWLEANLHHFPTHITQDAVGRIGFVGHEAEPDIVTLYRGKRLPEALGTATQNPVRYTY
ncbi:hypothetical protein VSX64_24915 [Aurantimonas sp. C2-6-R+9]|uniref:LEM-3-like GIY-YIG domain-containing protein n=1 Tax=unclassified Aurantimonas TaxID=2638230 RepID=UPI002E196F52|nr:MULTISPECIES: hypothetical protein [unclassified Aurantimonas]MEC5293772.1 hypothetical protein [Aurantimonas sp. C2-3-R2]MEC5383942.1 hypothetical protein [Aurantimonas sp. C2-6-R+9]MEC5414833.1 hypothetical protein [Aurantimonas sp. C2-4-R8]